MPNSSRRYNSRKKRKGTSKNKRNIPKFNSKKRRQYGGSTTPSGNNSVEITWKLPNSREFNKYKTIEGVNGNDPNILDNIAEMYVRIQYENIMKNTRQLLPQSTSLSKEDFKQGMRPYFLKTNFASTNRNKDLDNFMTLFNNDSTITSEVVRQKLDRHVNKFKTSRFVKDLKTNFYPLTPQKVKEMNKAKLRTSPTSEMSEIRELQRKLNKASARVDEANAAAARAIAEKKAAEKKAAAAISSNPTSNTEAQRKVDTEQRKAAEAQNEADALKAQLAALQKQNQSSSNEPLSLSKSVKNVLTKLNEGSPQTQSTTNTDSLSKSVKNVLTKLNKVSTPTTEENTLSEALEGEIEGLMKGLSIDDLLPLIKSNETPGSVEILKSKLTEYLYVQINQLKENLNMTDSDGDTFLDGLNYTPEPATSTPTTSTPATPAGIKSAIETLSQDGTIDNIGRDVIKILESLTEFNNITTNTKWIEKNRNRTQDEEELIEKFKKLFPNVPLDVDKPIDTIIANKGDIKGKFESKITELQKKLGETNFEKKKRRLRNYKSQRK